MREELLARDRLAARVAGDRAVLLDVVLELVRVEALGVVAGSPCDRRRRSSRRRACERMTRGVRADVAEALHDHRRAFEVEAVLLRPLDDAVDDALAGRLRRARACRRDATGLPVTTPFTVCLSTAPTMFMYVSIIHAIVWLFGADVGRGDVVLGADVRAERVGEAARDALELGLARPRAGRT